MEKSNESLTPPKIMWNNHPIVQGNYLFDTHEINSLKKEILGWIKGRTPGGIVFGNPRMGKTRALEFLVRSFEIEYPEDFKSFRFNCQKFIRPNENNFFEYLLRDLGNEFFNKGKASAKRDRLFKHLTYYGDLLKRKQIIIFMDDAQRLQEIEYEWLMDIFNELDRYGITLTSILFGQEELKYLRSTYSEANMKQIVGRFMIHEYNFRGISNKESLGYFLGGYDSASEFPDNSGWSFTRYYFPKAFSIGRRLEEFTEELWVMLKDMHTGGMRKTRFEIPMYHLTFVINTLYMNFGTGGREFDWINMDLIAKTLKNSGYYIFEGYSTN